MQFKHADACYICVHLCPSCAVRLRSQSHISWFLLSLTSGGTKSAVCVVWTGGRPEARPGRTPDKYERPDLSANFRADVLCFFKKWNKCALSGSCLHHNRFWRGGEARQRMETEQKQRQQRQTHNAPGLSTSTAETIHAEETHLLFPVPSLFSSKPVSAYRLQDPRLIYWLVGTKLTWPLVWSPRSAMTSPAKFRKDKEIVAEYETQVKGNTIIILERINV